MRVLAEPGVGNGSWQIQIRRKDSKKLVLPCLAVQVVRLMRLLCYDRAYLAVHACRGAGLHRERVCRARTHEVTLNT